MNGIIYCRVSSKEQTQGTSLESQEFACREYARAKRIDILKTFIEQGESAKFADRTQLLALIDFCRENKGKVETLIVWKVDRFARNVADHFSIKAAIAKYGVRIVSVTEPIDANPEGKLMETILAGFAEFDNNIRAMRSVLGMKRKLQEGIFPWKAPLGYKNSTGHREKKTRPDVANQPLFELLQRAWHEFATGAYTKAEIRRLMEGWGVQTEGGKPLTAQSIDHFFRNPFYAGILVDPWSKEECQGRHVPMVSHADFLRVQDIIIHRNRSIPHTKHRPEFPLRGLARCSGCQRYLTGSFSRGRGGRYPYYHCRTNSCSKWSKSIPAKAIHDEFESFITEIAPKEGLIATLGETIIRNAAIRARSSASQEAKRQDIKARLDQQNRELIRMRSESLISDAEFAAQRQQITLQLVAIEGQLVKSDQTLSNIRENVDRLVFPLQRLPSFWKELSGPVRRRFEHIVLPVGFVAGRIRTAEMGLLFRALGDLDVQNANGVAPISKSWNQLWAEITEFSDIVRQMNDVATESEEMV